VTVDLQKISRYEMPLYEISRFTEKLFLGGGQISKIVQNQYYYTSNIEHYHKKEPFGLRNLSSKNCFIAEQKR
jgi:hypothetical protein